MYVFSTFSTHSEQVDEFFEQDKFDNYEDVERILEELPLPSEIHYIKTKDSICFFTLGTNELTELPELLYGLVLKKDLSFSMCMNNLPVPATSFKHLLFNPGLVGSQTELSNVLAHLKSLYEGKAATDDFSRISFLSNKLEELSKQDGVSEDISLKLKFWTEQIRLSLVKKKARRYSPDTLAMATMWSTTSPALYKQLLQEDLIALPSQGYLKRLTQALNVSTGLSAETITYIQTRVKGLTEREKIMLLMMDEIHTAQRVEYAGGKVEGLKSDLATKTLMCVMIKSVASKFAEVISLSPMVNLKSTDLEEITKQVVPALHSCGLQVLVQSVDNYSSNRKYYKSLCSGELKANVPLSTFFSSDLEQPNPDPDVYLLFDTVHNFKNVYNNFINKGMFECPDFNGEKIGNPMFAHIVKLYDLELQKPAKMAHKLTEKVLHPSAIERTNVKLFDSMFHESTIHALQYYGKNGHPEFLETLPFFQLVRKAWNILNVKTPFLGQKKRDPSREPVRSVDDWKLVFLRDFQSWLEEWEDSKQKGLTKETFCAMKQTCGSIVPLATYLLIEKKFEYVLLGQLQSDPIEKRFGWYRGLAGSNYFISVRQVLEAEKTIRVKALVKFSKLSFLEIKDIFSPKFDRDDDEVHESAQNILKAREYSKLTLMKGETSDQALIFYIAGYASRSLIKILKCKECSNLLIDNVAAPQITLSPESSGMTKEEIEMKEDFLNQLNRGGLCTPSDVTYLSCLCAWSFFQEIMSASEAKNILLQSKETLKVFVASLAEAMTWEDETKEILELKCMAGHLFEDIFCQITGKMFNIFMKNHVNEQNSKIRGQGKKRTASTEKKSQKIKKLQSTSS